MEPLWSPVVATGGHRWQIGSAPKPRKHAKTVAVGCDRLRLALHGKQGVCRGLPPVAGGPLPAREEVDSMPAAERLAGGAVRTGRNGGRRRCSLNQPRLLERVVGENNAFLAYVSAFSTRHQFPRLSSSTAETAVQSAHGLIVPRRPSDDQERKPGREHRCERGGNGRQTESEWEEVSKTLGALGRPPSCRGTHGITHAQRP